MKNIKNEKGAITILVLVTMLFMVSFLVTTFIFVSNKAKTQEETIAATKSLYESESAEEMYNSFFGENNNLIEGFTEIKYIESTGTQWIDTGVILNQNSSIEVKSQLSNQITSDTQYCAIFGSRTSSRENRFDLIFGKTQSWSGYNNTSLTINTDYNIRTYKFDKNNIYIDEGLGGTMAYGIFTCPDSLCLFCNRTNGVEGQFFLGKLYYCKIWQGNTLIRDFIPVIRNSDNEPGLLDTLNDVFYINQGTGEFNIGPELIQNSNTNSIYTANPIYTVEQLLKIGSNEYVKINEEGGKYYFFSPNRLYILMNDLEFDEDNFVTILGEENNWTPIGETEIKFEGNGHKITVTKLDNMVIEYNKSNNYRNYYDNIGYIESTGTQWIDTGVILNQNSSIEVKSQLSNQITSDTQYCAIFGSRTSSRENRFDLIFGKTQSWPGYNNNSLEINTNYNITTYKFEKNNIYINEKLGGTIAYGVFTCPDSLCLFCNRTNRVEGQFFLGKLYYCKIWQENTLIRDFIPVIRNSDNKPGLLDTLNDVFYTNQGTGEFTLGPKVT